MKVRIRLDMPDSISILHPDREAWIRREPEYLEREMELEFLPRDSMMIELAIKWLPEPQFVLFCVTKVLWSERDNFVLVEVRRVILTENFGSKDFDLQVWTPAQTYKEAEKALV